MNHEPRRSHIDKGNSGGKDGWKPGNHPFSTFGGLPDGSPGISAGARIRGACIHFHAPPLLLRVHMAVAMDGSVKAEWQALAEIRSLKQHVFWQAGFSYHEVLSKTPSAGK
ncbi:MAG: hypothetical protein ACLFTU_04485 [Puniceicoccaceae bacterium]